MDKWADGWMDGDDPEDGEQGVEMEGDFEIRLGLPKRVLKRGSGEPSCERRASRACLEDSRPVDAQGESLSWSCTVCDPLLGSSKAAK